MYMTKSRDIQAKISLPQAIWNEFWLVAVNGVNSDNFVVIPSAYPGASDDYCINFLYF